MSTESVAAIESADSSVEAPPIAKSGPPPRALYLHFPFCVHRCHYCDFSVKRSVAPPVDSWLTAIEIELSWWFDRSGWAPGTLLDTILLGGGTPSLLGAQGMVELARRIAMWFKVDPDATEWTAEANPASFDPRIGSAWRAAGVNRLSLGVQSLDDNVLAWLGRLHDRQIAEAAVRAAKDAGFEQVSLDLMFGLPPDVPRDWGLELDRALMLDVSHVSLYGLTVEPRTPLAKRIRLGLVPEPEEARYADEYRLLSARLGDAGYEHYEVSNFARPGVQCRHNWYYWNRSPYLALGPSSHGFLPPIRTWNVFAWDRYERALRAGNGPVEGWERVSGAGESLERIWLGLRTNRGLPVELSDGSASNGERLQRWAAEGWLEQREERWVATVEGWLRMDAMVTEIAEGEGR